MEPVAGLAITPIIAAMMVYVNYLSSTYGSAANWWAFYVHAASWIVQFVGHGVFEKRIPAILVCPPFFHPPGVPIDKELISLWRDRITQSNRSSWHRSLSGSRSCSISVIVRSCKHGLRRRYRLN